MLTIGALINQRYRIDAMLEQTNVGALYRAWDTRSNRQVVIKENIDGSPAAYRQFEQESTSLLRLRHACLPRVIDSSFITGKGQYLVLEDVEGEEVLTILKRHGQLPEHLVLAWMDQLCDAVHYLHSQPVPIVHRDIRPGLIRITPEGQARLVSLGLTTLTDAYLQRTTGAQLTMPGYSPPEQYTAGPTDERSDVYALGASLYHLLTGQPPLDAPQRLSGVSLVSPRSLNPAISPEIERIILTAMELTPARRFQSVVALRAALRQASRSPAAGSEVPEPGGLSPRLTIGLALLAILAFGALLVVGLMALTRRPMPTNVPTPTSPPAVVLASPTPGATHTPSGTASAARLVEATPGPGEHTATLPVQTPAAVIAASATHTRVPSATPTPTMTRPQLSEPANRARLPAGRKVTLRWNWASDLDADQRYRATLRYPTGTIQEFTTVQTAYALPELSPGAYAWMVVVERKVTGGWAEVTRSTPGSFAVEAPPETAGEPTPTATLPVFPTPELVSPQEGVTAPRGMRTTFRWRWPGALPQDCTFEVVMWKEGSGQVPLAAQDAIETSLTMRATAGESYEVDIDVAGAAAVQQHGVGEYLWSVRVGCLRPNFQPVSAWPPGRRVMVNDPGQPGR